MVSPEHALLFVKEKSTVGGAFIFMVSIWPLITLLLSALSLTSISSYLKLPTEELGRVIVLEFVLVSDFKESLSSFNL